MIAAYDKSWALRELPPFPAVATKLLLTDTMGFDASTTRQTCTKEGIRSLSPPSARHRLDIDLEAMQAAITDKLDTFD